MGRKACVQAPWPTAGVCRKNPPAVVKAQSPSHKAGGAGKAPTSQPHSSAAPNLLSGRSAGQAGRSPTQMWGVAEEALGLEGLSLPAVAPGPWCKDRASPVLGPRGEGQKGAKRIEGLQWGWAEWGGPGWNRGRPQGRGRKGSGCGQGRRQRGWNGNGSASRKVGKVPPTCSCPEPQETLIHL